MRGAHILAGCVALSLFGACYAAPADSDKSYVLPINGNSQNVAVNGNSLDGNSYALVPLGGTVSGLFANATLVLANGNNQLTITQNGGFSFATTVAVGTAYSVYVMGQPTAQQCSVYAGQGVATSAGVNVNVTCTMMLRFNTNQAARTVIGQPDFQSYARNFNQTVAAANSASNPWGTSYTSATGVVYLTDSLNCRLLGFNSLPATNGAAADFLAGQPNFAANGLSVGSNSFGYLAGVSSDHRGGLLMTDMVNNRVVFYAHEFTQSNPAVTGVVGQPGLNSNTAGCSATTLNRPLSAITDGNVLAVGDASNNRVLLWRTLPAANAMGTAATLVLGQPDLGTCNIPSGTGAQTIKNPQGVWIQGQTLAVVAVAENRVLFWYDLSTLLTNGVNGVAPDAVIGQSDFTGSAAGAGTTGLNGPQYVMSDGSQFIIADTENNRVLFYGTLTPGNGQAASGVLGQPDYSTVTAGGGNSGMHGPDGLGISGTSLIVAEGSNARFTVFDSN